MGSGAEDDLYTASPLAGRSGGNPPVAPIVIFNDSDRRQAPAGGEGPFDSVSKIATLAVGVIGPAYALGFLSLWAQFFIHYGVPSSEAWYATSLLSRTTVIGQTMYGILVSIGNVLVLCLLAAAYFIFAVRTPAVIRMFGISRGQGLRPHGISRQERDEAAREFRMSLFSVKGLLLSGLAVIAYAVIMYFGVIASDGEDHGLERFSISDPRDMSGNEVWRIVLGLAVPIGLTAAVLSSYTIIRNGNPITVARLIAGVLAFYGFVFLSFAVSSFWEAPRLPSAHLLIQPATGTASIIDGKLIGHDAGYWYVFLEDEERVAGIAAASVSRVMVGGDGSPRGWVTPHVSGSPLPGTPRPGTPIHATPVTGSPSASSLAATPVGTAQS